VFKNSTTQPLLANVSKFSLPVEQLEMNLSLAGICKENASGVNATFKLINGPLPLPMSCICQVKINLFPRYVS
jgi:hypothetical protein